MFKGEQARGREAESLRRFEEGPDFIDEEVSSFILSHSRVTSGKVEKERRTVADSLNVGC